MIASAVRLYQDHYKITRLSNEADEEAQRMSIKDYYKITRLSNLDVIKRKSKWN